LKTLTLTRTRPDGTVEEVDAEQLWERAERAERALAELQREFNELSQSFIAEQNRHAEARGLHQKACDLAETIRAERDDARRELAEAERQMSVEWMAKKDARFDAEAFSDQLDEARELLREWMEGRGPRANIYARTSTFLTPTAPAACTCPGDGRTRVDCPVHFLTWTPRADPRPAPQCEHVGSVRGYTNDGWGADRRCVFVKGHTGVHGCPEGKIAPFRRAEPPAPRCTCTFNEAGPWKYPPEDHAPDCPVRKAGQAADSDESFSRLNTNSSDKTGG
jgi:hypothetical protein